MCDAKETFEKIDDCWHQLTRAGETLVSTMRALLDSRKDRQWVLTVRLPAKTSATPVSVRSELSISSGNTGSDPDTSL